MFRFTWFFRGWVGLLKRPFCSFCVFLRLARQVQSFIIYKSNLATNTTLTLSVIIITASIIITVDHPKLSAVQAGASVQAVWQASRLFKTWKTNIQRTHKQANKHNEQATNATSIYEKNANNQTNKLTNK